MAAGRVVLIGAVHEALPALRAVASHPLADLVRVVTLTPETARKTSGAIDVGGAAAQLGVDVTYADDVNHPEVVDELRASQPDLIVVVGWTRLIHDELLALPRRGCTGFHASLLPRHRGRAPVNWAIIRGERETGNTMMLLDRGADTGLIIDQRSTPIGPGDTCATVYERVANLGAQMLTTNLGPLLDGTAELRQQEHSRADVLPKRTPAMGVTDWTRTAPEIHDWIRALTEPYPGAFTHLDRRQVMLWSSAQPRRSTSGDHSAPPGMVLGSGPDGLAVATGAGTLMVTQVSDPSDRPISAQAWCEQHGVARGTQFDIPSREVAAWSLGLGPKPPGAAA